MKPLNNYIQESIIDNNANKDNIDDIIKQDIFATIKNKNNTNIYISDEQENYIKGLVDISEIENLDDLIQFDKKGNIVLNFNNKKFQSSSQLSILFSGDKSIESFKRIFKGRKISEIINFTVCFERINRINLNDIFTKDCHPTFIMK